MQMHFRSCVDALVVHELIDRRLGIYTTPSHNCMQMHCECGHKWCYVCVVDLGKDADINGETSHRIESTGCPMYLEELAGILWHR